MTNFTVLELDGHPPSSELEPDLASLLASLPELEADDPRAHAISSQVWDRLLRISDPVQRLDALLSLPGCESLVPLLPAQDLFVWVQQVGIEDASELVGLSTPEQFRTYVDLGAWRQDEPDTTLFASWVRALLQGQPDRAAQVIDQLDSEFVGLVLRRLLRVHPLEPDDEVPSVEHLLFLTDDRCFAVELCDPATEDLARALLAARLEVHGPLGVSRYLSLLVTETEATLWFEADRWRRARMEELGFPPYDEAILLYAPLSKDELRGAGETEPPPAAARSLARQAGGSLLARALELLEPESRARLEFDLVCLFNALSVVGSIDPGDDEAVERILRRGRGYVEIALQVLSYQNPDQAARILDAQGPRKLFRRTATTLHGLMRRARAITGLARRLPEPESACLGALASLPPTRPDGSEITRPEHIAEAERALARLEGLALLAASPDCMALPSEAPLLVVLGTVLANRWLGGFGPLPLPELRRFVREAFVDGKAGPRLREEAEHWTAAILPDEALATELAQVCCASLCEELAGLHPDAPLDPRFVGGVLVCDEPPPLPTGACA